MILKERILAELKNGSLSDRELADKLLGVKSPQQSINGACRKLAAEGAITRTAPPIRNVLTGTKHDPLPPAKQDSPLGEESIKKVFNDDLISRGWQTKVARGGSHGIDIDARRGHERWIIEVKGCGSLNPMQVNYFLGILGEVLQRMEDPAARYSIALPDMQQFRKLWARLPSLAKQRTTIDAIFISQDGGIDFVK